jgi:hypothetical protein
MAVVGIIAAIIVAFIASAIVAFFLMGVKF